MLEAEERWRGWQKVRPGRSAAVLQGQNPPPRSSQHGAAVGGMVCVLCCEWFVGKDE